MPLEDEDYAHLVTAEGYLALGMHLEANAELEEIESDVRNMPEVLEVQMEVYRALEQWELIQTVARKLAQYDPSDVQWTVSWAFATRRAECIDAARAILLEAVERLPGAAIFHYNLACYECQLGEIEVAKARLEALDEEDLRPAKSEKHLPWCPAHGCWRSLRAP